MAKNGHFKLFKAYKAVLRVFLCKNHEKNPGARQQVPVVYEINTIVWIYSRKAIFSGNKRIPKRTLIFKTPINRSIDIDTKDDINRIYFYLNKKKYAK